MMFSAIQKFTLLDYPGKTSCIAFTPGCDFRCGYCHNPEFVLPEKIQKISASFIAEETFYHFLEKRRGLLDGVVISGGEPTIMHGLLACMKRIKEMGFLVKLDTNGNRPHIIQEAIDAKVVDYVAMDIKTIPEKYPELVGKNAQPGNIRESIDILVHSGVEYEFRTTVVKSIHDENMLHSMAEKIRGASVWHLQRFRPQKTLDPDFSKESSYSAHEMARIAKELEKYVEKIGIRF